MDTNSEEYKDHLENKYLPGRDKYLQWFFYPKILKQFNNGEIMDLGCGTGEFLRFLKLKKRKFIGIDNNPYLVNKCINLGFNVKIDDITNLSNIDFPVENAICDNVLEHLDLKQIDKFFASIKSKMSPGGILVIIVPDVKGFRHDPTHITFINRENIESMCSKYNIRLKNFFYHPFNIKLIGKLLYLNMQTYVIKF